MAIIAAPFTMKQFRGSMKKRYVYVLLFGIPGLFVAGLLSIVMFGGIMGILWLYVFGDHPWPAYTEQVVSILFVLTVLVLWLISVAVGYVIGKQLEQDPALHRSHVLLSLALTFMFLLLMLFQQWNIGNLGPKTESVICSDFCTQHGYAGSGMPSQNSGDRTCSCYDSAGNETLKIPLDHIDLTAPK
jgi:hypothetical protein